MKELIKICAQYNGLQLLKQKSVRQRLKQIEVNLKPFQINCTCKSDFAFFTLCIMEQAWENKNTIEQAYEQVARTMFDIWEDLDYKKRNEFACSALNEIKEKLPYFELMDNRIFIPFFDELMNALYDREVAVLQLPQFFKLYKEFRDRMIDPYQYGALPYQHGFCDVQFIAGFEAGFGFYVKENHSIYVIGLEKQVTILPLSIKNRTDFIDVTKAASVVEAILNHDVQKVTQWCINCGQMEERCKKKCIQYLKKIS